MISNDMLSQGYSIFWAVLCVPFLFFGLWHGMKNIRQADWRGFLGGSLYTLVLSSQAQFYFAGVPTKPTGLAPSVIVFGWSRTVIVNALIVVFQAAVLGQGGAYALGANIFSFAIVGGLAVSFTYKILANVKISRYTAYFIAAFMGSVFTYLCVCVQLSLMEAGFWNSLWGYVKLFAVKQIPLSFVDGFLCAGIFALITAIKSREGAK